MLRVAILVPAYNSSGTIRETLESIQSQSNGSTHLPDVYLADDCSSDATLKIAQTSWKPEFPHLHVLRRERNFGQWKNVNDLMGQMVGKYDWILLLHADDVAKPQWLELMLNRIELSSAAVGSICCSWDDWMSDGRVFPGEDDPTRSIEVIPGNQSAVRGTLLKGCWWHISGCAIRVKVFESVGEFNPNFPQLGDLEWLLRFLECGWSVEYIPRTLIKYRQHSQSVSSSSFRTDRDIRESLEIIYRYAGWLTRGDLLRNHLKKVLWCVRRLLRAIVSFDVNRSGETIKTCWYVLSSLLKCIARRKSRRCPGES
jgi:glycosyltransferase involved in cell wall biosynthesis